MAQPGAPLRRAQPAFTSGQAMESVLLNGGAPFLHMRIDRFTQKMQEALQAAQDRAAKAGHSEITNEHFLLSLLEQSDGVARPLLDKMGVPAKTLEDYLAL